MNILQNVALGAAGFIVGAILVWVAKPGCVHCTKRDEKGRFTK